MKTAESPPFPAEKLRADFPILAQRIHRDRPLIYFDNGASTQRPRSVIEAMHAFYESNYGNVHRGIHYLSEQASELYEAARTRTANFIGARDPREVIFTSGTTEAINLVAHAWGNEHLQAGDEILLTLMEHHSNIVPWQQLAARTGALVRWVELTPTGELDWEDWEAKLTERTRIVAASAVSNVLGTINPVAEMTRRAHAMGARILIDAAQHTPHDVTNVQDWDADFVTFSGHKALGPTGIGFLYGKRELLEAMPPFMGGGSMISTVTLDGFTPGELPAKFEAGTPPIAEAIGWGAALDYLEPLGMAAIFAHERALTERLLSQLEGIEGLRVLGPPLEKRGGIVSFVVPGLSTQDIALLLDRQGVAIRAGHHCAMPLHEWLHVPNSCRASFYLYNTSDEVDQFVEILAGVLRKLRG